MSNQLRILQLSDSHLLAKPQDAFLGIKPYDTLQAVINCVDETVANLPPQLIVFTGDISQDDSQQSYQNALKLLQHFTCPIIWTSGNHDETKKASQYLTPWQYRPEYALNHWHLIILNSHWDNHVAGRLNPLELKILEHALNTHKKQHILIFIHHHIVPVGSHWLDQINLQNAQDFFSITDKYSNIKAIVSGHVHQEHSSNRHSTSIITTPATSFQFKPQQKTFTLDALMPGFRLFDLHEDGHFDTQVIRVKSQKKFIPDLTQKGY